MLKNKIIEILIDHQPKEILHDGSTVGFVQYTEYGLIAYEIEQFINQEVERRIKEMPRRDELINEAQKVSKIKLSEREKALIRITYNILRSRLTEKPNNSTTSWTDNNYTPLITKGDKR